MPYVRMDTYELVMTATVLRKEAEDCARLAASAPEGSRVREVLTGIAGRHADLANRIWPEPGKQLTTHTGGTDGQDVGHTQLHSPVR